MKRYCLLFFSLIFFGSCHKETDRPDKPIKQNGLWPLNFNNEWNYRRFFYNNDGTVRSYSDEQTKITDTITVEGQLHFGDKITGQFLANIDSNTVRSTAGSYQLNHPYSVLFKRVFINDTIIWSIDDQNCNSNLSFRSYTDIVNVNGYDCLRNERLTKKCDGTINAKEVFYLKPGVGLVKFEEYVLEPGTAKLVLRIGVELRSYKLY